MKILIALDESKHSELALESVKTRVWPRGTKFCLCTVVNNFPTASVNLHNCSRPTLQKLQEEMEAEALNILEERKADLLQTQPDAEIALKMEVGPASDKIIAAAVKWDADVIVLGSHGRHGVQRYALGSVSESVVERAPCSVDVIKASKKGNCLLNQKRILACYDKSRNADASLAWISQGKWSPDQEFVVMSVLAPLEDMVPPSFNEKRACEKIKAQLLDEAQEMLESRCSSLRRCLKGTRIIPVAIDGYAAETIVKFADRWEADLIVLGTHTAATTEGAPPDSVARRVVANANCLVKLVKDKFQSSSHELQGLNADRAELALR